MLKPQTADSIFRSRADGEQFWIDRGNNVFAVFMVRKLQIHFLLGHASIQTAERYLGCEQKLRNAVNDNIGLGES